MSRNNYVNYLDWNRYLYIKSMAFEYKRKDDNDRQLLHAIHNTKHNHSMVVGAASYHSSIHMHLWVQDALLA
jgi:hypothetical protein